MCGTESISSMAPNIWSLVPQEMKNCRSPYSFKGRYKEMETKLSISVMQNLLETCWFFITKMCGIWRITFLSVLFICYFIYMLYNNYVKVNFMERIVIIIIIQISYQFENFPFARKIKVKLQLQWTSFSQWFKGSQEQS